VKTHRSLEAWKEARLVTRLVIMAAREHWRPWAAALFSQLQRAALSVQLNLAEGASFGRSATYTRHLGIAYGSAVETWELIEHLTDAGAIPAEVASRLAFHSRRSRALLVGLLKVHRPMT
jgi:four helix bundle protein